MAAKRKASAKRKPSAKKDLESKIAALEAKLNQLSAKIESKPEAPKPEAPKPEAPKPEPPKPAETTTQPPATLQEALENAYMTAPMTDVHHYKAKTTGFTPAPNRYYVRKTAPVGRVPTS
ncbi:MAG: trans-sialidase, partial [Nitrosopumilus sp.]